MTIEERAYKYTASCGAGDIWDQVITAMEAALRDQVEECAKVLDVKVEDWKHSMKTIKHFTGTYEEVDLMEDMAKAIRALAEPSKGGETDDS